MRKFFTFDGTGEKVVFVQKFENDDSALADAIHLSRVSQVSVCEILPDGEIKVCLLYTSPSPRDGLLSRMPSSA